MAPDLALRSRRAVTPGPRGGPGARGLAAVACAAAASMALSGCNEREWGELLRVVILMVLLAVVLQISVAFVLVVNTVLLLRKTPSLGWGAAALLGGVLQLLPTALTLSAVVKPRPVTLFSVVCVAGLFYVGWRNVREAPRPPPPAPPPPLPPPP